MSRSVDLFIQCNHSTPDLVAALTDATGLSFELDPLVEGWVTKEESFTAVLRERRTGRGSNLVLGGFQYSLSSEVEAEGRLRDAAETIMLRLVADQLQHTEGLSVLLVLDLQNRPQSSDGSDISPDAADPVPHAADRAGPSADQL